MLAALCRARQIPARLVNSYLLYPAAPGFHTWLEVWLANAGRTPFDLFGWGLSFAHPDAAWRDCFFGRLEHRMVVERAPRLFAGPGAVRSPAVWRRLISRDGRGGVVAFEAQGSGALVYRENVEVERLGEGPAISR